MKVKELIRRLSKENQDCEVLLSRDEEGNGFEPLVGIELCKYEKEYGEVYSDDDEEAPEECKTVIVLWP